MSHVVEAIYENGVLRLLGSLSGVPDHSRVRVTIESADSVESPFADCIGILPDEDAEEMRRIIEAEFEQVDPREW